jgi:hypothetical protein
MYHESNAEASLIAGGLYPVRYQARFASIVLALIFLFGRIIGYRALYLKFLQEVRLLSFSIPSRPQLSCGKHLI